MKSQVTLPMVRPPSLNYLLSNAKPLSCRTDSNYFRMSVEESVVDARQTTKQRLATVMKIINEALALLDDMDEEEDLFH